jgi:uncharacterized protein
MEHTRFQVRCPQGGGLSDTLRMPTTSNKAVALEFLEAIAAGDTLRIQQLVDPDLRWWVQGWGAMDGGAFLASLFTTIARASIRKMTVLFVTAEENRVAVAAEGEFVFPEGTYSNTYHYLFTVANGKLVTGREYLDTTVAARFFSA